MKAQHQKRSEQKKQLILLEEYEAKDTLYEASGKGQREQAAHLDSLKTSQSQRDLSAANIANLENNQKLEFV